ncbi:MAG: mannose-6-phosphate isomerase, class I [Desulfobacterales bacterium]|nr:mannose-6-phosphate isomerase, class I [Desulfobacterales bacterium]MDX2511530.1 mannose-6-phosphate isomerase, class I [Desulfobacterales bacterium]
MKHITYLRNTIQEYAWGSRTAIAELMGQPSPAARPQAEIWMGAHPKAPSLVATENGWDSLLDLIQAQPVEILGKKVAEKFDGKLPYLFKVLAAAEPLSIQAHPGAVDAQEGYAREEALAIPFDALERNYKDPHHKPECLCALTSFWGLCGFRNISETATLLHQLCPESLQESFNQLDKPIPDFSTQAFFQSIMHMSSRKQAGVVREAVNHAEARKHERPEYDWVVRLHHAYPSDIGVIFPAILNLVHLQPGQALFLEQGELHAYLSGVGIELMANSDNVLRGGLTSKHVDVAELMRILSFKEKDVEILLPENREQQVGVYQTPAREFELSVITLDAGGQYTGQADRSVEILLCTSGQHIITESHSMKPLEFKKGSSVLVPAAVPGYTIHGEGVIYKAAVPI